MYFQQWRQGDFNAAETGKNYGFEDIDPDQTIQSVLPVPPIISQFEEKLSVNAMERQTKALARAMKFHDLQTELTKMETDTEERFWIQLYTIQALLLLVVLTSILLFIKWIRQCLTVQMNNIKPYWDTTFLMLHFIFLKFDIYCMH